MIRRARLEDLPQIEALLLAAKRRSEYCTVKVEFERARKVIRQCISGAMGFCAVADHEGQLTGCLIGLTTHYWFSAERFATDIGFYSRRRGDGLALLRAFKEWADERGATLQLGQSSGRHAETLDRLYRGEGLARLGVLYIGEKPINVRLSQLRSAS